VTLQPAEPKHFFSSILIPISKLDFGVVNPVAVGSSMGSSFASSFGAHLIAVVVAAGAPVESVLPNVKPRHQPQLPYGGDDHGNPVELLWPSRLMDGRRQQLMRFWAWPCGRPRRRRWLDMNGSFGSAERRPQWRKTALPVETPSHRGQIVT
jgi:hypothetical protein